VPSILIETGFISNRDDENLLRNKSFQLKLAKSLSKVSLVFVDMLVKRNGITVSDGTARKGKGEVHLVKPHETLWRIARDYNTTVDKLIRLNNLKKSGHVRAGKKLLLP